MRNVGGIMNNQSLEFSINKLNGGELIGLGIIEITTIPSVSILQEADRSNINFISKYKTDFSNLLSELYQNFRTRPDYSNSNSIDTSIELLLITEKVSNQPYNANIRLFLIYRNISNNENELYNNLSEIQFICISTLNLQKYEYPLMMYKDLSSIINKINTTDIRAIGKDERV